MSTQLPDETRPRFRHRQLHFDINIGCFPALCVLAIVAIIIVFWFALTHPPVDYIRVALVLLAISVPLLLLTPRLRGFREIHQMLVSLEYAILVITQSISQQRSSLWGIVASIN